MNFRLKWQDIQKNTAAYTDKLRGKWFYNVKQKKQDMDGRWKMQLLNEMKRGNKRYNERYNERNYTRDYGKNDGKNSKKSNEQFDAFANEKCKERSDKLIRVHAMKRYIKMKKSTGKRFEKIFAMILAVVTVFLCEAVTGPFFSDGVWRVLAQDKGGQAEIQELEEGTYVRGEALVAMTTTQAADLAKEGTAGFDPDIQIEECWDFGKAQGAQSEQIRDYVALISSDIYSTEELMEIAAKRYYVDAVAPNSYAHFCDTGKDTLADYQWYLDGAGAVKTQSEGIHFSDLKITPYMQPVVAMIDTGVDYTNKDIKDAMWVNPYQSKGLPGTYGYDFAEDDADPMDTHGHGTHCAGIVAAQANNGTGIAGISHAKIMALKVAKDEKDTFDTASVVEAFEYIVQAQKLGVKVAAVNCSWGGGRDTGAVLNTLINKMGQNGALTVFAAGNDAVNWDAVAIPMRQTPYDLKSKYVVVVGASDENDERVYFSDYGNTQVDLFAPGSNIVSTVQEPKFLPQFWEPGKRGRMTSYYNTIDSADGFCSAASIQGMQTDYAVSISYEPEIGFSDQMNGCLKYTVRQNRRVLFPRSTGSTVMEDGREQAGFIYLDVTPLQLDTDKTYYISCLMAENDGEGIPAWESVEKVSSPDDSRFVTANGRTYLAIIGITTRSMKTSTYYFDNIAVSVADPDINQFEKCDIMSGSSMSGPMVTGAVAVLRSANPFLDALGIRKLLMQCTRNADALENACVTGGILDLSGVVVQASRIKLNKTTANVRLGKTLQLKATVSPSNVTNADVKWVSSNSRYATVSSKGKVTVKKAGVGKTVKISAVTKDGTKLKETCKVKILKA